MKFYLNTFIIILVSTIMAFGQFGIKRNSPEALESYTLFESDIGTFLIDNCGEIVNSWPDVRWTNLHSKLLPNGNLIYISNNAVVEVDWDGQEVSRTSPFENTLNLTYEVIVLPNGNYLCLARRIRNSQFFNLNGYDQISQSPELDDSVVELEPITGDIVWEWNISDHIIQDKDSNKNNFGVIKDNPRLLNVDAISDFDWTNSETFMINGMDYNAELDQIVLSVRKISEIVIIDHSTTTEEAKGSTGGRYGHGGDALYRWGNLQNYEQGTSSDRVLYYQHNPNWIEFGEHKGKIIIHNNGLNRPGTSFSNRYSSAEIIDPLQSSPGNYSLVGDSIYHPLVSDLAFNRLTTNTEWYSGYTSSTKVLPNGNIFITEGRHDRFLEVNHLGNTVWEYENEFGSYIFRAEKYPLSYEAFNNKLLVPNGSVESNSTNYNCMLFTTAVEDPEFEKNDINVVYNDNSLKISSEDGGNFNLGIYNQIGSRILVANNSKNAYSIPTLNLQSGIYIVTAYSSNYKIISTKKVFVP